MITKEKKQNKKFKFIDLFAGIGGMRKAFENLGGTCVFTSEWDKYCLETYKSNFDCNHLIEGDIRKVHESHIPNHDILIGGFPCQPFSLAGVSKKNSLGKKHGFLDETQGTLFFDVARIIKHKKPKAILLENVKNLINHDKGNTFQVIKDILTNELGYQIQFKVFNSHPFVPQKRERIFIVGFLEQTSFSLDNVKHPKNKNFLNSILHPENGNENQEPPYTNGAKAKVAPKYTLSDKLWNYLQMYAKKHAEKGNGFGFGLVGPDDISRTMSARYHKDGSEILIRQKNKNPRRLTPRECARLMGFDSTMEHFFKIPVSDTQAYKQFGNAVVPPLVENIGKEIVLHI
jgi:DNA (cytosine-5)-methyltransferase 1